VQVADRVRGAVGRLPGQAIGRRHRGRRHTL